MEWMGWFSFFIILCYSSYPGKVKRLEKKVKKFERNQKGEGSMSKIISSLVGQVCKIRSEEAIFESLECNCTILEVDDEWVKILHTNKKGDTKIKILRIEDIKNIEFVENNIK